MNYAATKSIWRQGDVALKFSYPNYSAYVTVNKGRSLVLAEGEKTGHSHVLELDPSAEGEIKANTVNGSEYVTIPGPAVLRHQEHGPVALAAGTYEVLRQKEYAGDGAYKNVRD